MKSKEYLKQIATTEVIDCTYWKRFRSVRNHKNKERWY